MDFNSEITSIYDLPIFNLTKKNSVTLIILNIILHQPEYTPLYSIFSIKNYVLT